MKDRPSESTKFHTDIVLYAFAFLKGGSFHGLVVISCYFFDWEHPLYHSMASKEYTLIREEDSTDEVFKHHHDQGLGFSKRHQFLCNIVSIALALALAANILFIILHFLHRPCEIRSNKTAFGRVAPDVCIAQLINDSQLVLSATKTSHGPMTAILPATTEQYGIKPGRL